MNKETLEEVALKYAEDFDLSFYDKIDQIPIRQFAETDFMAGAKWQQERMYSELSLYLQQKADEDRLKSLTSNQIRAIIEQFKKK